jgi:hypothetical protein
MTARIARPDLADTGQRAPWVVGHHAALSQPVTEPAEGLIGTLPIEQERRFAHAASIS